MANIFQWLSCATAMVPFESTIEKLRSEKLNPSPLVKIGVSACTVYLCLIIDSVYSDYFVSLGCSNVLTSKMEVPEVRKYRKNRKKMNYSIFLRCMFTLAMCMRYNYSR